MKTKNQPKQTVIKTNDKKNEAPASQQQYRKFDIWLKYHKANSQNGLARRCRN